MKIKLLKYAALTVTFITAPLSATPININSDYSVSHVGQGTCCGYGTAIFEGSDLYFTSGSGGSIYNIDSNGVQSLFGTTPGTSMGLLADGGILYAGDTSGNISTFDLATGNLLSPFYSFGSQTVNDMELANSNSSFFGSMLVATSTGLHAIDLLTKSITTIANGLFNNIEFASDGSFYTTNYSNGVNHYLTDGSLNYSSSISGLDGLAIHGGTGKIYLANSRLKSILEFDANTRTTSTFASSVDFDGGWFPSPLQFNSDNSELIFGERDGSIWSISGFQKTGSTDVPEPSTLAIFVLGILGLVSRQLKK